jgi:Membrane bound O-acyl transferase family
MWALSFAMFLALKWMSWWAKREQVEPTRGRSLAYLLAWPGMDAAAFLDPDRHANRPGIREWFWAALKTAGGAVLVWVVARRIPANQSLLRGWIGLVGLIFLLHFGSFHLIALFWQEHGIDARPIMSNPMAAKSLSQFWGRRWNLGFHQLAHDFVFRPLDKRMGRTMAGLVVFLVSGLIHDLVISVPARGGYGLPTGYFLLQAAGVIFERSTLAGRMRLRGDIWARAFTVLVTAGPAFWLFHPPFVHRVMIPFMHAVHAL